MDYEVKEMTAALGRNDPQQLVRMALPATVDYVLQRRYLDDRAALSSIFTLFEPAYQSTPALIRLTQLGSPEDGDWRRLCIALQHVLTGCHSPGEFQFIYLLASDGRRQSVHFGIRSHFSAQLPPEEYVSNISSVLRSEWAGTESVESNPDELPLADFSHVAAVTGVPCPMISGYHQGVSLETLANGMTGKPFAMLVIAEPLPSEAVDHAVFVCREILSQAETFASIGYSDSTNWASQVSEQITKATGHSVASGTSESSKHLNGRSLLLSAGMLLLAPHLAGADLAAQLAFGGIGLGGMSLLTPTNSVTRTDSITDTESVTRGTSTTDGGSRGTTVSAVNAHMQAAAEDLRRFSSRLVEARSRGCWDTSVYLLGEDEQAVSKAGLLLRSLFTGKTTEMDPIRVHSMGGFSQTKLCAALRDLERPAFQLCSAETRRPIVHPLGVPFSSLSTPLTTEELSSWLSLPKREIEGITILPACGDFTVNPPEPVGPSVRIGTCINHGSATKVDYGISCEQLAKHTLVCGISGSGKSITCRRVLQGLMEGQPDDVPGRNESLPIPFLVVEPAKDEYVEWAMRVNDDTPGMINVFMPGRRTWNGRPLADFFLNPFDIVWLDSDAEPRVLEHIDRLKTILTAALPMQEVLPVLMEELIYRVYMVSLKKDLEEGASDPSQAKQYRWLPQDSQNDRLPLPEMRRPTFTQLRNHVKSVIGERGYEDRLSKDLKAALTTRIDSFRRGWRSTVLNQERPDRAFWGTLFDKPTVVNLAALTSDDDKAFFMAVLMQFLHEYRQAQHERDRKGLLRTPTLKHLIVIEEAHRILCGARDTGPGTANPMAKVGEMFSSMLSEVRAYGQGVLIADQVPGRLNPDAIKNTNLKIVHRLVSGDDREMMSICLDLKPSHARVLGSLRPGQALVRSDMDNQAAWVKVHRSKWDESPEEEGTTWTRKR